MFHWKTYKVLSVFTNIDNNQYNRIETMALNSRKKNNVKSKIKKYSRFQKKSLSNAARNFSCIIQKLTT